MLPLDVGECAQDGLLGGGGAIPEESQGIRGMRSNNYLVEHCGGAIGSDGHACSQERANICFDI